jgi:hypothetical protein
LIAWDQCKMHGTFIWKKQSAERDFWTLQGGTYTNDAVCTDAPAASAAFGRLSRLGSREDPDGGKVSSIVLIIQTPTRQIHHDRTQLIDRFRTFHRLEQKRTSCATQSTSHILHTEEILLDKGGGDRILWGIHSTTLSIFPPLADTTQRQDLRRQRRHHHGLERRRLLDSSGASSGCGKRVFGARSHGG